MSVNIICLIVIFLFQWKTTIRMAQRTIRSVGNKHPTIFPTFLCLPDLVKGIPVAREILRLAEEMPTARFHENENPCLRPIVGECYARTA